MVSLVGTTVSLMVIYSHYVDVNNGIACWYDRLFNGYTQSLRRG